MISRTESPTCLLTSYFEIQNTTVHQFTSDSYCWQKHVQINVEYHYFMNNWKRLLLWRICYLTRVLNHFHSSIITSFKNYYYF